MNQNKDPGIRFENSDGYHIETIEGCTKITYPGGTVCTLYPVVPGIILSLVHVKAGDLPSMNSAQGACLFTVNYARDGVCEMRTEDGNYVYVKAGEVCISRELPDQQFRYPTGSYDGIEIFFFKEAAEDPSGILGYFHIDINFILNHYLESGEATMIAERADSLEADLQNIGDMSDGGRIDVPLLQISCLHMLRMLTRGIFCLKPVTVSALTPAQLSMAEKAKNILTGHLEKRIPVRMIAEEMGISETSLKNYFRAVYGQNVSDYLLKARMSKAEVLLRESRLTIGEIANQTGYRGQSRFDDAFRRYTGITPSEWRRRNAEM